MRRDLGGGTGATGEDDWADLPRKRAADPSEEENFEWPPRQTHEPSAIERFDSTDRSAVAARDQVRLRYAADVDGVSERPDSSAELPLRQPHNQATPSFAGPSSLEPFHLEPTRIEPRIEPSRRLVSYTYRHITPPLLEHPSSPLAPAAQPVPMFPVGPRARAVALALVGVSLIAALEGVFIWRTMRDPSGTLPIAVQPGPQVTPHAAAPPASDRRAITDNASGTSNRGKKPALASGNGRLVVNSEPPGAQVSIDGQVYGVTPLTRENLSPGEHRVVLKGNGAEVRQTVRVESGATVSVVAPLKPRALASGWIAIESPVEMDVFADGVPVGTTRSPKITLQEGEHTLVLINESIGYREKQSVRVKAGALVSVVVTLPQSIIQITAVPWAEVWVDGKSVGVTPIGDLRITIGPHEVVFRHPELGEKTVAAVVKSGETTLVSADLTRLNVIPR